jgi:hypothetical protein
MRLRGDIVAIDEKMMKKEELPEFACNSFENTSPKRKRVVQPPPNR